MTRQRTIPHTDVAVSLLGMGCARLGSIGSYQGQHQTDRLLAAALDHGITTFDTSGSYAQGRSEALLAHGLKSSSRLHDAIIITKIGFLPSWGPRSVKLAIKGYYKLASRVGIGTANRQCFEPRFLRRATERSLRRLRRDHIDVLMLHSPPPDIIHREELHGLLKSMQSEGKIRTFGFSSLKPQAEHIAQAIHYPVVGTRPVPSITEDLAHRSTGVLAYETFNSAPQKIRDYGSTLRQTAELPGISSIIIGMSTPDHIQSNTAALAALSEFGHNSTQ